MAVDKKIEALLAPVKIPIAYRAFRPYKNKPVPNPPYLIYLIEHEAAYGADYKNLVKEKNVRVELYADKKELKLEEKVEQALSAYDHDKYEDFIESEAMYMTAYEFTVFEKVRRNSNGK